jgi:hypothetical protein
MEAIQPMRHFDRAWELLAVAALLVALAIGGAAGYAIRLATAPTVNLTKVVSSHPSSNGAAGAPVCAKLPDVAKGAAC